MHNDAIARRFSVLVVDDNRDAADSLADLLRLHGHDARVAYGGEQALAVVRQWHRDAAVLDDVMSGVSDVELAAQIRNEARRPILLVALTGLGTGDEVARVKAGAFDSVVLKPVDPDELLGAARRAGAPATVGTLLSRSIAARRTTQHPPAGGDAFHH
jgi:CheY-like chemotaxis protein